MRATGFRRWFRLAGLAVVLGSPAAALAAPFCVAVVGLPPQCNYVDPSVCQRDAAHQGGTCTVNAAEVSLPSSPLKRNYCVVGIGGFTRCGYANYDDCYQAAIRQNGACTRAATSEAYGVANPYAAIGETAPAAVQPGMPAAQAPPLQVPAGVPAARAPTRQPGQNDNGD